MSCRFWAEDMEHVGEPVLGNGLYRFVGSRQWIALGCFWAALGPLLGRSGRSWFTLGPLWGALFPIIVSDTVLLAMSMIYRAKTVSEPVLAGSTLRIIEFCRL